MKKMDVIILIIIAILQGCNNGSAIEIGENGFEFAIKGDIYTPDIWYSDVSVTGGIGCDSAFWNDTIIIGMKNYISEDSLLKFSKNKIQSKYFVVNMEKYKLNPVQELSSGFIGMLNDSEFISYVRANNLTDISFQGLKLYGDRLFEKSQNSKVKK